MTTRNLLYKGIEREVFILRLAFDGLPFVLNMKGNNFHMLPNQMVDIKSV